MMPKYKVPYGFKLLSNGDLTIYEPEAAAVRLIYAEYLLGKSLGGICIALKSSGYLSPVGKSDWSRSSVDNILGRGIYLAGIITFEQMCDVQFERERRTNVDADTGKRKATRYCSNREMVVV